MKMITKVLLTAAALVALAAPAMAADKLVIKDSAGTSDVFKVDDAGQVVLPKAGINRGSMMANPSTVDNFAYVAFAPEQTAPNAGTSFQVMPKGTGYNANIKAQLAVFSTDLIADPVNYESLTLRAGGTAFSINMSKAGTGSLRPIQFQIQNQAKMTIDTTGYVGIGTTTPTSPLAVAGLPTFANNAAALAGPPVLKAGDLYKTSTGQVMVVY